MDSGDRELRLMRSQQVGEHLSSWIAELDAHLEPRIHAFRTPLLKIAC